MRKLAGCARSGERGWLALPESDKRQWPRTKYQPRKTSRLAIDMRRRNLMKLKGVQRVRVAMRIIYSLMGNCAFNVPGTFSMERDGIWCLRCKRACCLAEFQLSAFSCVGFTSSSRTLRRLFSMYRGLIGVFEEQSTDYRVTKCSFLLEHNQSSAREQISMRSILTLPIPDLWSPYSICPDSGSLGSHVAPFARSDQSRERLIFCLAMFASPRLEYLALFASSWLLPPASAGNLDLRFVDNNTSSSVTLSETATKPSVSA